MASYVEQLEIQVEELRQRLADSEKLCDFYRIERAEYRLYFHYYLYIVREGFRENQLHFISRFDAVNFIRSSKPNNHDIYFAKKMVDHLEKSRYILMPPAEDIIKMQIVVEGYHIELSPKETKIPILLPNRRYITIWSKD